MFCLNCAKQIGDITKNRICPYCGYEQYKLEDVQAGIEYAKRKSKENRNGGFSEEEILALGLYPKDEACLLYTSPSPRDRTRSRMPSSA